jgi:hypothetical protein
MSGARVGNGASPVRVPWPQAPASVRVTRSASVVLTLPPGRPSLDDGRRRRRADAPPARSRRRRGRGGTGGHGRDGVRETSSAGREEARSGVTRRRATRLLSPLVATSRPSGVAAGRDAAVAFYSHIARVVLAARGLSDAGQQSTAPSVRVPAWVQTGYLAGAGSSPPCRRPPRMRTDRRRARSPTEGKR